MNDSPTDANSDPRSIDPAAAPTRRYAALESRLQTIVAPMARASTRSSPGAAVTPPRRRSRRSWRAGAAATVVAGLAFGLVQARTSQSPLRPIVASAVAAPAPIVPHAVPAPHPVALANLAVAAPEPSRVTPAISPPASIERRTASRYAIATPLLRTTRSTPDGPCQLADAGARYECLKYNLQQADRALVDAYADARDANVPLRRMINVNRRWDDARRAVRDDPDGALATYRALTTELRSVTGREDRGRDG